MAGTVLLLICASLAATADDSAPAKPDEGPPNRFTVRVVEAGTHFRISAAKVIVHRRIFRERSSVETTKHETDAAGEIAFSVSAEQAADPTLYFEIEAEHSLHFPTRLLLTRDELKAEDNSTPTAIIELALGAEISGRVELPDGQPAVDVALRSLGARHLPDGQRYFTTLQATTDSRGEFYIDAASIGQGVLWILPRDYAGMAVVIKQPGDQGVFRLRRGAVLSGVVRDVDGRPMANQWVTARREGGNTEVDALQQQIGPQQECITRSALTDADGAFQLNPLPPGSYTVEPAEYSSEISPREDPRRQRRRLSAVFLTEKMLIDDSGLPHTIELQALPHVVVRAKVIDSRGNPVPDLGILLEGQFRQENARMNQAFSDAAGAIEFYAPQGLRNVTLRFPTSTLNAVRHRLNPNADLNNRAMESFATVEEIPVLEIVRYQAPRLTALVVDAADAPIGNVEINGKYLPGRRPFDGTSLQSSPPWDVYFVHEAESGEYSATSMLPDEEMIVTISAPGYVAHEETISLAEGEKHELKIVLKRVEDAHQD